MKEYYPTIGLEVHAELATKSKMFCGCKNDPDEESPNMNICAVCMAHPGSLPVINKQALKNVVSVGLALGGQIADFTEFDRKNYFYPDIPKGYQISQYKFPIVSGGELNGVSITRVHLEEDTGTSKHLPDNKKIEAYSLVDFNRAGVPLMELVTEPVIKSAEQASSFARELQLLFKYLGVSEANMEKGEMRVEANISISPDPKSFGTKVEVKNLNSFRSVERAIEYEIKRMTELYESGREGEIVQETRGWDETKQSTFSQRSKEDAHDYRYFPDPDLPKLILSEVFDIPEMLKSLPETPKLKRIRYQEQFQIKSEDVESFINDTDLGMYFEDVVTCFDKNKDEAEKLAKIKLASNYITSDLVGLKKKDVSFEFPHSHHLAELVEMIHAGEISSRTAKDLLVILKTEDRSPKLIAEEKGLIQKNDPEALKGIAQKIIDQNAQVSSDYKSGKEAALQFLIGQFMKETKGSANPSVAKEILVDLLK
jgi:aspartyl-tRNA(Asn)/glutamyl-tRNA(Gln) amidotransferase subunit B